MSGVSFEHDVSGDGDRRRVTIHTDVDPSYNDSISVREPDARPYDDTLEPLDLPASGEQLETCGDDFHGLFCPDCGEPQQVGQTCRRALCDRCYKSWAFHRAQANVAKLESRRAELERERSGWFLFHHLTVSFRPEIGFNANDPEKRAREVVKGLLREVAVEDALLVLHTHRIKKEYRGDVKGHSSGSGDMTWKDVIAKFEGDEWPDEAVYDEFLEFSPHFHVLCVSDFVQCGAITEDLQDRTGIVIHRITKRQSSTSLEDIEDLAGAMTYAFSHCAQKHTGGRYQAQYQAIGDLHNHKASDRAEAKAAEAVRKVAPDTLGLSMPEPTCTAPVGHDHDHSSDHGHACDHDHGHDHEPMPEPTTSPPTPGVGVSAGSQQLAGAGRMDLPTRRDGWDRSSSGGSDSTGRIAADGGRVDPEAVAEATAGGDPEPDEPTCGATLRPMWVVDDYLGSDDWRSSIDDDALDRLVEARDDWRELGKPAPENDPVTSSAEPEGPPPDAQGAD